jgi:alkylated DNA repair dioxygenase AlkB
MTLPAGFALTPGWMQGLDIDAIVRDTAWRQPMIKLFGKAIPAPRLTAWFGDGAYSYSGDDNPPAPMPEWLEGLRARAEAHAGARFNSVLLNLYRDGRDSVGYHADDEPELGAEPTIASLSIGADRVFAVRSARSPQAGGLWTRVLSDGDLLVMSGRSQLDYKHALPKAPPKRECGPRVNATFRWVAV